MHGESFSLSTQNTSNAYFILVITIINEWTENKEILLIIQRGSSI